MNAVMTMGIQSTVEAWTGDRPLTCPWRALFDPFVERVQKACRAFDKGQLRNPSARLMAGVLHFGAAIDRCQSKQLEQEAEARKRG